jgi:hypothetical protein
MKYIITESKLNNIIFKYLDMKYGALEQKKGRYSDIVFTFHGEEYGVLGWEKSGDLYVCYELRYEISNLFGLENVNSLRVIGKWVEDKYNLKVTNTYSQLNNMQYLVEGIYKVNSKDRMKSIITESKINSLVSNYLDGQKWYTWDIGDGEFNVADGEYGKDVIHYRIQESITVPDRMFDLIYVDGMFVTRLSKLFGLEAVRDVNPLVVNWFNKKYDKNLNKDDWEWMDNEEDEEEDF